MQHAPAQESAQDVDMNDFNSTKFKEIRDRFFSTARPSDAPSQPTPPQLSALGNAADKRDQTSASASPRSHMDSGIAGLQQAAYGAMSNEDVSEDSPEANKSKRELSTSKRAAQNRAAQRAFRQRKERYITELEEKVKRFQTMETDFRSVQDENARLREYILGLQSQLLQQNREPSYSAPPSPPRRRRAPNRDDAEQVVEQEAASGLPHPSAGFNTAAQRAAPAGETSSWSEHIDGIRQRSDGYPTHRPSMDGEASSSAAEGKRAAQE